MRDRISYHETETFDRLAATPWIEKREHELAKPGVIAKYKAADPPLANAIARYTGESLKEIGRISPTAYPLNRHQATAPPHRLRM